MAYTLTKGSTVEVTSDEPGFEGAWYVATLEDEVSGSPTKKKSSNKKNKNIRYLVKYETLFQDDNLCEQLTELIDPSLVRPLPPTNIRRNNDDNVKEAEVVVGEDVGDFELYDVVDAYHRDGWWLGVVKNVIVDVEGEMNKFVVSFENPPEEFEFEKSKMRLHVDWVDRRWFVPPKKTADQVLGDKNASGDAFSSFTTPSKGTLKAHEDNVAVGPSISAKRNGRSRTRSETNSAGDISVTYSRNKRNANSVEGDSRKKRFQSSAGGKGNTKAIVSVLETSGSDVHQDSPSMEHSIVITQTCEAEDGSKSHQKRKRGRKPKLAVNKPIGLLEDVHGLGTDIDEQPLAVWYQGLHPLSVLKKSSCFSPPDNSLNQAIVASGGAGDGTTTTDYQKDWPFIKRAQIWAAIESMDLYQTPPQKPHFSPLKNMKKDYREGLAIALMVTYGNLVQGLPDLQLNDPADIIKTSLETLCELETHGFDVGSVQVRLNELLSLKSKVGVHEDRLKEVENELEKCNRENTRVQKEMDRLKAKMQVLKEKTVQAAAMQKSKEKEIVKLQKNLDLVSKEINDWELAFEDLCKKGLTLA